MKPRSIITGLVLCIAISGAGAFAGEVVALDHVSLDSQALDNGCSTETLKADEVRECRYRVCFSLLKSLWLAEEAERRHLEPDPESVERQQRQFEKSHMGEQLKFTVLPRLKFQREVIELFRKGRSDDPDFSFDDLWKDVETSATALEIPERALRALVSTYGLDQQRFLEFQKMFPDDHESAMERTRNSWEREARRVALEKAISPDDKLTSAELAKAKVEWQREMELAPDATDAMLRDRKRQYNVNLYLRKQISENARFADVEFRKGLLNWIDEKILAPDESVFGQKSAE